MRSRCFLVAGLAVFAAMSVCAFGATAAASGKPEAAGKSGKTRTSRKRHRRERGQKAPTRERISEIQQALEKDGSYAGKPNGKWDASTVEAVRKFQGAHGLNPTGKLDAPTLQKLGLGSDTAGVAAPLPPVSTSSTTPQATRQF